MIKATNLKMDPQESKGKTIDYIVTCMLFDTAIKEGGHRLSFYLGREFMESLPKSTAEKNKLISSHIKKKIKSLHKKLKEKSTAEKPKPASIDGADLIKKIGFDEMAESDFT